MIESNFEEIEERAMSLSAEGKKWHFHMLTPTCLLNDTDKHAFVLEDQSSNQAFIAYSDKRNFALGKKLVEFSHKNVLTEEGTPSQQIQPIITRAAALNKQNISWHHHMLFPECIFNNHKGKWNIIFEDPETGKKMCALYDEEPLSDLPSVEQLFYAQKK